MVILYTELMNTYGEIEGIIPPLFDSDHSQIGVAQIDNPSLLFGLINDGITDYAMTTPLWHIKFVTNCIVFCHKT